MKNISFTEVEQPAKLEVVPVVEVHFHCDVASVNSNANARFMWTSLGVAIDLIAVVVVLACKLRPSRRQGCDPAMSDSKFNLQQAQEEALNVQTVEASAEITFGDQASALQSSAKEAPEEKAPAKVAPVRDAHEAKPPAEETPAGVASAEQAPAEKVDTEQAAVEKDTTSQEELWVYVSQLYKQMTGTPVRTEIATAAPESSCPFEFQDEQKMHRAARRARDLHIKRAVYKENKETVPVHKVAGNPHGMARAATRTFLAKDKVEACMDLPSISFMGRPGRAQWARKPSVSPLLSYNKEGSQACNRQAPKLIRMAAKKAHRQACLLGGDGYRPEEEAAAVQALAEGGAAAAQAVAEEAAAVATEQAVAEKATSQTRRRACNRQAPRLITMAAKIGSQAGRPAGRRPKHYFRPEVRR
jgi:hypothetical protein